MLSPKRQLQLILKRLGIYNRLRASALYSLYWSVADRSVVDDANRELTFYRGLLKGFRSGDLIFDVGANHGAKTEVFLRLGAKVVALDPDEANKVILEEKFLRYRLSPKPVTVINKAVSDRISTEVLWIEAPGSAKNTLCRKWADGLKTDDRRFGRTFAFAHSREVITTTLEQLFERHGSPFFVKIDVEGHELSVLQGMRRPVPYLSFEVNLPEFLSEGLSCVEVLGGLAGSGTFNYSSDCRDGLALTEWLGPLEFSRVLSRCQDSSIEIFWKNYDDGQTPGKQ
jgi:FkbM family methyltransferase